MSRTLQLISYYSQVRVSRTYGNGKNKMEQHPMMVFPQSIPRLWNRGTDTIGIAAAIMDRTKSFDASAEAA